ncbi:MAG: DUF4358 domain-containing protein [Oscillospiraceae bacterium]
MKYCLKIIILSIMTMLILAFSGCGTVAHTESSKSPKSQPITTDTANTSGALDEIYRNCKVKGISDVDDKELTELLHFNLDDIDAYDIRYSKDGYGVMDTYIIKPYPENVANVKLQLESRLDDLTREYENYDIYNSYSRCENAVIFEQGDYLILLVMDDNDAAKEIINKYIPAK